MTIPWENIEKQFCFFLLFLIEIINFQSLSVANEQTTAISTRSKVRVYCQVNEHKIITELIDLLSIPNLASDSINIRKNANKLVAMLEQRGVRAQLLEVASSPPAVFGELKTPGAKRTLMFYAHYDGQPVAALKWDTEPCLLHSMPSAPTN
jgi:hypothetical protein